MRIYVERYVDAAHRVVGHQGKCARLHGHTYRFEVWLRGYDLDELGMLIDFGYVKDVLDQWDHRAVLWSEDSLCAPILADDPGHVVIEPWNPTAENMAIAAAARIKAQSKSLKEVTVRCWETRSAYAEAHEE